MPKPWVWKAQTALAESRPGLLPPRLDARPRVGDGLAALRLLLVYKDVRDRAAMEGELQAQLREIESIQRGREE